MDPPAVRRFSRHLAIVGLSLRPIDRSFTTVEMQNTIPQSMVCGMRNPFTTMI
jgi:hypothetical protein